jgi:hypothetical protein
MYKTADFGGFLYLAFAFSRVMAVMARAGSLPHDSGSSLGN